ncbi:hypothetical protein [Pseudonocardia ailaonensis]|uniref:hypothetical protein n=1 Tax=Pseudonocardia ailaonensis TaxID=367279 RepID=UPI0031CE5A60
MATTVYCRRRGARGMSIDDRADVIHAAAIGQPSFDGPFRSSCHNDGRHRRLDSAKPLCFNPKKPNRLPHRHGRSEAPTFDVAAAGRIRIDSDLLIRRCRPEGTTMTCDLAQQPAMPTGASA